MGSQTDRGTGSWTAGTHAVYIVNFEPSSEIGEEKLVIMALILTSCLTVSKEYSMTSGYWRMERFAWEGEDEGGLGKDDLSYAAYNSGWRAQVR